MTRAVAVASPQARKMPVTLREFSQWLDWVAGGKTGTPVTGENVSAGELYQALSYEAIAKAALPSLARDKEVALLWLQRYHEKGISHDPQVTTEYKYIESPGRVVAAHRKVNGDRLKSRYPALWVQSRTWTPYRSVKLAPSLAPTPVAEPPGGLLPMSHSRDELMAMSRSQWEVSWGQAYDRYRQRLDEMKPHHQVIDEAAAIMARLLTDERIKAEYAQHWDGHGQLEFDCGSKLQMDRMQFSQDLAAEVVLGAVGIDLDTVMELVPEHQNAPTRRIVKVDYERHGEQEHDEGIGNPFEGD